MHFITFPVASTNIFPLSNSSRGGQLVTEYNLKSREMVATNPEIKFPVGPSFIHSMDDFKVTLLSDISVPDYDATSVYSQGDYCIYEGVTYVCTTDILSPEPFNIEHWAITAISTSILQIAPGRAVINGHFVETLAPMQIDMNLANAELKRNAQEPLYGNLSIGIKSYFSTEATMSGAMLVENTDNMYVGVQIVIDKTVNFKVPGDEGCKAANEQGNATADIKLADFTYLNGVITPSSITPNTNATQYIPSDRISNFDDIFDGKYVTSDDLIERMFYTFSGKSKNWCNSTGSLMVWDAHSDQNWSTEVPDPRITEASFLTNAEDGSVHLVIPHKQPDGDIFGDNGSKMYYQHKDIAFPTADFARSTSGIVTADYTQRIKDIAAVINTYKQFTNGKQIIYLDSLSMDSEGNTSYVFPRDLSKFNVGDYILVREDFTVAGTTDSGASPSTMYFVLPGGVTAVTPENLTTTEPSGVRLGNPYDLWEKDGADVPTTTSPSAEDLLEMFAYTTYRGTSDDYFEILYHSDDDSTVTSYYYPVSATGPKTWSEAVLLTGGIPLATETQVGGFYNASTDAEYADAGYVYLDDTGHLRLRDYGLLRSGVLAYQLGEDFRIPSNQTLEYIQGYLDESVNARVAFLTRAELTSTPTMINVYIPLPEEEGVLNIYNIDSRFGTGVYIHFLVDAGDKTKDYSNIVINVTDCEKVRIDNSITTLTNGPVINIFRSCLYYDAQLIDYIRVCDVHSYRATMFATYPDFAGFDDLSLWYARFTTSDPNLSVNGMEVIQPNVAIATQDLDFWNSTIANDNHYSYALRSITLSSKGQLIACSMYVSNETTVNVNTTTHVVIGGDFIIPQGSELNYPMACLTQPIKITGTFTTAYAASTPNEWIVTETSFTAKSGVYNQSEGVENGSIVFNSQSDLVPTTYMSNTEVLEAWAPGSYHIFYGGTTI